MEALLFLIDAVAMVLLAYWSVANDARTPDEPTTGLFRMADPPRRRAAGAAFRPEAAADPAPGPSRSPR